MLTYADVFRDWLHLLLHLCCRAPPSDGKDLPKDSVVILAVMLTFFFILCAVLAVFLRYWVSRANDFEKIRKHLRRKLKLTQEDG